MSRLRERTTATLLIAIFMISAISIVVPKRAHVLADSSGPRIDYFQLIYHISNEPDGRTTLGYSINGRIYNPDDTVMDGYIQGFYEGGEFLADVITTDPEDEEYSITNKIYDYKIISVPQWEYLEFFFTRLPIEELRVGTYTTELIRLEDNYIFDTITFSTPYEDEQGNPTLPPYNYPVLTYPINGQTIVDTTPTFTWEPFELYEGADSLEWAMYMEWDINYHWRIHGNIWNPPLDKLMISFPNAQEHSGIAIDKYPEGEDFPSELKTGPYYLSLVAREWFFQGHEGWDSRCRFYTAYAWTIIFHVVDLIATIDIDPDTLNLRSKGRWITAYIDLPEGYSVEDIDIETIALHYGNKQISAEWGKIQEDVLMVKFDRCSVVAMFGQVDEVELTVKGELQNGIQFGDSDTIRVLEKKKK